MDLEKFISRYDTTKIKKLEQNDPQFLALQKAWNKIKDKNENLFLFLAIQWALVSYQLSGTWELWRQEFGEKISLDRTFLQKLKENDDWWFNFLTNSKYNKRLYNMKISRIKKFNKIFSSEIDFKKYENDLSKFNIDLAKTMKTKPDNKTIVFAVKIFSYAYQIVFEKEMLFPMSIPIPVDSRLTKIYKLENPWISKTSQKEIQNYFQKISQKFNIPPLHLDSVLWLDYRKFIQKKK